MGVLLVCVHLVSLLLFGHVVPVPALLKPDPTPI